MSLATPWAPRWSSCPSTTTNEVPSISSCAGNADDAALRFQGICQRGGVAGAGKQVSFAAGAVVRWSPALGAWSASAVGHDSHLFGAGRMTAASRCASLTRSWQATDSTQLTSACVSTTGSGRPSGAGRCASAHSPLPCSGDLGTAIRLAAILQDGKHTVAARWAWAGRCTRPSRSFASNGPSTPRPAISKHDQCRRVRATDSKGAGAQELVRKRQPHARGSCRDRVPQRP
jgi:hypothetical protein